MANLKLKTSHALYANVVRGLSADPGQQLLLDSIPAGTDDLALQANPGCITLEENANVTPGQGIATDGAHWYEIDTGEIVKSVFATGAVVTTNSTPYTGLPSGIDHLGDGFTTGGLLYVPATDWNNGAQTATKQTIAVYDVSDLSLDSQIDISASTGCGASGICIGHTGNYFATSYTTVAGPDDRLRDIYEFNSSGTEIAIHTLDGDIEAMQGIDYDPENGFYIITADDAPNSVIIVNESFQIQARLNPTGIGFSEMEGCCYYGGDFYAHERLESIRKLILDGVYIHPSLGTPTQFLANADIPDSGSIVMRLMPGSLFQFNSIWDNNNTSNDWESWIYSDGRVAGRVKSGSTAVSASGTATALVEQIIGFSWAKSGSTVDYDIVHDGTIEQTRTGIAWVAAPASGLYIGGINSSNDIADINYRDIIVYNKRLSSTEWADLAADFDGVYETGSLILVTANQTEAPETQAVSLQNVVNLLTTQISASETQSVLINNPINLANTQTEDSESQLSNLNVLVNLISSQGEVSETQLSNLNVLASLISAQGEVGESQLSQLESLIALNAAQSEFPEQQIANLRSLADLVVSQNELQEAQIVNVETIVSVASSQTELPESQLASVVASDAISLIINQTEASETQNILVQSLIDILCTQTEEAEQQSSIVNNLISMSAAQVENAEQQFAFLASVLTTLITATQTESSELQNLLIEGVLSVSGNQTELSETQLAALQVPTNANLIISQLETSEINSLVINSIATLQATQTEASETQLANILEIIIYQALNELAVRLEPEYAVKLEGEYSVIIADDNAVTINPDA